MSDHVVIGGIITCKFCGYEYHWARDITDGEVLGHHDSSGRPIEQWDMKRGRRGFVSPENVEKDFCEVCIEIVERDKWAKERLDEFYLAHEPPRSFFVMVLIFQI